MSRFHREALGVGISAVRISCATFESARAHIRQADLAAADPFDVSEALTTALADARYATQRNIRVVLSPDCLREWVMEVPAGVRSMSELQQTAAARFTQLYCEPHEQWSVTADWRAHGPMLCAAMPLRLVESIHTAVKQRGARLRMTAATAIAAGDAMAALPDPAWLYIRAFDHASLLSIRRGVVGVLRHLRTGAMDSAGQLALVAAEIARICLRSNGSVPARAFVYDSTGSTRAPVVAGAIEFVPAIGRLSSAVQAAAPACDADAAAILGAIS